MSEPVFVELSVDPPVERPTPTLPAPAPTITFDGPVEYPPDVHELAHGHEVPLGQVEGLVVLGVLVLVLIYASAFTVSQTQQALVLQFGRVRTVRTRTALFGEGGIWWCLSWAALAIPLRSSSIAPSTVDVSGETVAASPRPKTIIAGSTCHQ